MSKNNERGSEEAAVLVVIAILIGLIVWGGIVWGSRSVQYNNFLRECRAAEGVVMDTRTGILGNRIDCYKDGQLIKVPSGEY